MGPKQVLQPQIKMDMGVIAMILEADLLNTQHYKVRIKGKG